MSELRRQAGQRFADVFELAAPLCLAAIETHDVAASSDGGIDD